MTRITCRPLDSGCVCYCFWDVTPCSVVQFVSLWQVTAREERPTGTVRGQVSVCAEYVFVIQTEVKYANFRSC